MSEAALLGPASATLAINTARLAVLAADRIEAVLPRPRARRTRPRLPRRSADVTHGVPRT